MANTSTSLVDMDFDDIKTKLKTYLSSQAIFKDYDFDGSNINVLLDILSHNSFINTFYLNMISNEMHLDTAKLRDSVVSHAKDLNYVPRSSTAAFAVVDIEIVPSSTTNLPSTVVIAKGTSFTARDSDQTLTFTTDRNTTAELVNDRYVAKDVSLYEGTYVTESYIADLNNHTRFIMNNNNIDIRDINVSVLEDGGSNVYPYKRAYTLFGLQNNSQVFFVQASYDSKYELVFGDNVIGRTPQHGSTILVEYRVNHGEAGNGLRQFVTNGAIGGHSTVNVVTKTVASGGAEQESLNSIKYNAPRHFTTQERAVGTEDYETLLRINFPEINGVSAFGGEDANPPQYGRVIIAVDLKNVDGLPNNKIEQYTKFLKKRSPLTSDPIFIEPDYLYLDVSTKVRYNVNITSLNTEDIKTFVIAAIEQYNTSNLNNFSKKLRYSPFTTTIDNSHSSIVGNQTKIRLIKRTQPPLNRASNFEVKFDIQLADDVAVHGNRRKTSDTHTITSSPFIFDSQRCVLVDDGEGTISIAALAGDQYVSLIDVGTVDYQTGFVQISNFRISSFEGNALKIYARAYDEDIIATRGSILLIDQQDVSVQVEAVRE